MDLMKTKQTLNHNQEQSQELIHKNSKEKLFLHKKIKSQKENQLILEKMVIRLTVHN